MVPLNRVPQLSSEVSSALAQSLANYNGFGDLFEREPLRSYSSALSDEARSQIEFRRLLQNGAFIEQGIDLVVNKLSRGRISGATIFRALRAADESSDLACQKLSRNCGGEMAESIVEGARQQEHVTLLQVAISIERAKNFVAALIAEGVKDESGHLNRVSKLCTTTEVGLSAYQAEKAVRGGVVIQLDFQ